MSGALAVLSAVLLSMGGVSDAEVYCADSTMVECIVVVGGVDALSGDQVFLPDSAEPVYPSRWAGTRPHEIVRDKHLTWNVTSLYS